MKAMVQERFGPPESLRFEDVEVPGVGAGEVLLRVDAAAVNPYDWHMLRGDPRVARLLGGIGLRRPRARIAGIDVAGRVEAVGAGVHELRPGDDVFGFAPAGAFAEYAVAPARLVVPRPAGVSAAEAAAMPTAGTTALRAVREVGRVAAGQRFLVNGAAGGIGTIAVQLAAAAGAEVTGVCGPANTELVRSLGADHVIDHTATDVTDGGTRFDVVLDNVGNHPLRRIRRVLTPEGTLMHNAGGRPGKVVGAMGGFFRIAVTNPFTRQRLTVVPTRLDRDELLTLRDLLAVGAVRPVTGRGYGLADVPAALREVEAGHVRGKLVITVR